VTDFLSSLFERATGQAPVLERRRASLFEPVMGAMPLDDQQDQPTLREAEIEVVSENVSGARQSLGVESGERFKHSSADRASTPPAKSRNTRDETTLLLQPGALSESKPARADRSDPSLSTVVERVENSPGLAPKSPLPQAPAPAAPREVKVPIRVVETRIEREVVVSDPAKDMHPDLIERNRRPNFSQPELPVIKPLVRRTGSQQETESTRQSRPDEKLEPATSRPQIRSIQPSELPQPFPRPLVSMPRRSARSKPNAPPSPPTIQVTIGRVEVRATRPPAAIKPLPPRATPQLSLEDYLRSRSGERA
jgi:hypothetical protein